MSKVVPLFPSNKKPLPNGKVCSACGFEKPGTTEFFSPSGKGLRRQKVLAWKKSDITVGFLQKLYEEQEGLCRWFRIPLETELDRGLRQISLDRLDCSRGYTQDNVVLACRSANFARNDEDPSVFNKFIDLLRVGLEGRD